jgi:PAS domain S-box-containing protein
LSTGEQLILTHSQSGEVVVEVADLASSNKKSVICVLHVDDDPSLLEITKLMLLDLDSSFEIDGACCVDEAFGKLAVGHYDVVVSDFEMPQKNGLQFLKELREKNNKIPFILFTGKGREEVAIKALNFGADAYHNKLGSPETVYGELTHSIKLIVERNKTKKALREQDIMFTKLAAQTPGMLFQFLRRPDGTFCVPFTSDGIYDIFGCSPQDVQKDFSPIAKVMVPEDLEKVIRSIEHSAAHLSLWQCEYRVQLPGQKIRWLWGQSAPERLEDGSILWSGYNTDITERKNAEEKLRGTFDVLERVGEGIGAGLAVIGKDYRVVWANKRLMDLGVAPNKKCYQTFNRSETICPDCGVKKIFEENVPLDVHEYKTVNAQGETIWVELRVTPLKDNDGNVTAALELVVAITERKKAEDELSDKDKRFRAIFDKSFQFALLLDTNGNVLEMNELCYTVHGPLAKVSLGKPFWEATWWNKFPDVAEKTKLAIQSCQVGKIVHDEVKFIDKDFQIHHGISIFSPITDENGKLLYISVVGLDISERKQAEAALQKSEERFRQVSENAEEWLWEVDSNGLYTYSSSVVEKLLGYKPEEIVGKKHFYDLFLTDEQEELKKAALQAFASKNSFSGFLNRNMHKNGNIVWLSTSGVPILNEKGNLLGYRGLDIDLTERRKADEVIRASEEKHRKLYEESLDAIFLADAETGIMIDCNRAALELVGREKSEIIGQHQRILHPTHEIEGDSARVFKQHQKQSGVSEGQVITKTGEIKDISIKSSHVVVGDRKVLQGVFRDVTESKKAQNALLVSEEKYRETIQNANIGVVAYRSDGEITILNPTMQKMTGYTIEEIPSLSEWFGKLYPNEVERQKIKDKWFKKLTEVGEVKEGQATIITKQGEERIFVFDGFRLHSGDFIAFTRDITELKKTEAHRKVLERKIDEYSKHLKCMVDLRTVQLKDTNERLVKSERLAAIGELAGMVGHDLRNPLAGIKNAVYFLKKKGKTISEAQAKEMLETIDKALEHSDKIINDLLDYAREMHLELTKYAAHTLVDEALRMIQVPNRIQIVNHVDEETWIWVNADKMMRVFINLIKNAIDAMPQKGTLRISSCQTKECAEIVFADAGTGIPTETLHKLFMPLFTTKAQGMGFGLAICKRIIEAHGGTINVKTELNKGTTFTVTLPLKPK